MTAAQSGNPPKRSKVRGKKNREKTVICLVGAFILGAFIYLFFFPTLSKAEALRREGDASAAKAMLTTLVEWFGDSEAMAQLGAIYAGESDMTNALTHLDRAVSQGNVSAKYHLAEMILFRKVYDRDTEDALSFLQSSSEQGNADAQALWGALLMFGVETESNEDAGASFLLSAAEKGNIDAQFLAGLHLVEKYDAERGLHLLRTAADAENVYAHASLAEILYFGQPGIEKKRDEAREFLLRARRGERTAKNSLPLFQSEAWKNLISARLSAVESDMAYFGNGEPADRAKAKKLADEALQTDFDNCHALYIQGLLLRDGGGGQDTNPNQTRAVFEKAAGRDKAEAARELAFMMRDGIGGPRNFEEAHAQFIKAEQLGDVRSRMEVGKNFFYGRGA